MKAIETKTEINGTEIRLAATPTATGSVITVSGAKNPSLLNDQLLLRGTTYSVIQRAEGHDVSCLRVNGAIEITVNSEATPSVEVLKDLGVWLATSSDESLQMAATV